MSYGRRHSVTSVRTFLECPQRYYLRYVKRLKVEQEVPQAWRFGTCVHAALEAAYLSASRTKPDPRLGPTMLEHRPAAVLALEQAWTKEGMPTDHGALDRGIETVDQALECLTRSDRDDVVGVEYKFDSATPDGSPFVGFTDLLLRVSRDTLLVRDWKVTGKRTTPEELAADLQLNSYAHFARVDFPWAERVVVEHWYPTQARLGAPPPCVSVPSTQDAQDEAVEVIESTVEMIEAESEWPARVSEACESCVFRLHGCPAWADAAEATSALAAF